MSSSYHLNVRVSFVQQHFQLNISYQILNIRQALISNFLGYAYVHSCLLISFEMPYKTFQKSLKYFTTVKDGESEYHGF